MAACGAEAAPGGGGAGRPGGSRAAAAAAQGDGILSDLGGMLRGMARTGRADPALPGRISGLRRAVGGARSLLGASRGGDWFFVCQAAFKLGLVLDQMGSGLCDEMGGRGRPGIASGSLSALPAMSRALATVMSDAARTGLADDALDALMDLADRSDDAGPNTPVEDLCGMIGRKKWDRMTPLVANNPES